MEVQGVYLDQTWDDKFSDPSSVEFKRMAAEKEFQLYALLQMNDLHRHIRGKGLHAFSFIGNTHINDTSLNLAYSET